MFKKTPKIQFLLLCSSLFVSTTLFSQNKEKQTDAPPQTKPLDTITQTPTYQTPQQKLQTPNDTVYTEVSEVTTPPIFFKEGLTVFYKYFVTRFRTPDVNLGKKRLLLVLEFIVEKDGSISHIKAIENPGDEFVVEGIRVLESLPYWKPARLNGEPVRYLQKIPITIGHP